MVFNLIKLTSLLLGPMLLSLLYQYARLLQQVDTVTHVNFNTEFIQKYISFDNYVYVISLLQFDKMITYKYKIAHFKAHYFTVLRWFQSENG